jgi:hypothetical protein
MIANLKLPNLPLYLYRYRNISPKLDAAGKLVERIDREISAIEEPYIWCDTFNNLNDPMEGFYRVSSVLKKQTDSSKILRLIADNKIAVGIAGLSDTKEHELMWTHYADNYAGICIEYLSGRLLDGLPDDADLVRMAYDDLPPRITSKDSMYPENAARKIFSQKKFNWAYEREWRVLASVGAVPIAAKGVVRSIYIGSRVTDTHKEKIVGAFKRSDVRLYEMNVKKYKHNWKRINRPPKKSK